MPPPTRRAAGSAAAGLSVVLFLAVSFAVVAASASHPASAGDR